MYSGESFGIQILAQSHRDHAWCRVAHISCQRTEQSAPPRQLVYAPAYPEHTNAERSKVLERSTRHVCQRISNERKEVNDILTLTNISIAAAGAAVSDKCSGHLAFVVYRNSL